MTVNGLGNLFRNDIPSVRLTKYWLLLMLYLLLLLKHIWIYVCIYAELRFWLALCKIAFILIKSFAIPYAFEVILTLSNRQYLLVRSLLNPLVPEKCGSKFTCVFSRLIFRIGYSKSTFNFVCPLCNVNGVCSLRVNNISRQCYVNHYYGTLIENRIARGTNDDTLDSFIRTV